MNNIKNNKKLLSLCIPTNGIKQWVKPVIDSIYSQNISEDLFEVIITDNGSNIEFEEYMISILKLHDNLIYKKTNAEQFLNQIEAFKLATGDFIKFINHRMPLIDKSLQYLIDFVKNNYEEKPITYFLNGSLHMKNLVEKYKSFDEFIKGLSYYSSWSAGLACWKNDFENMKEIERYNLLFPHITMLFEIRCNRNYCIDNHFIQTTLPTDETKKGTYNLFYAFGVEYVSLLLELFRDRSISYDTFEYIRKQNGKFIIELYYYYIVRKKKVSYDLSNYKIYLGIFYDLKEIKWKSFKLIVEKVLYKFRINKEKQNRNI